MTGEENGGAKSNPRPWLLGATVAGQRKPWEAQGSEPKLGSSCPRAGFPVALGGEPSSGSSRPILGAAAMMVAATLHLLLCGE